MDALALTSSVVKGPAERLMAEEWNHRCIPMYTDVDGGVGQRGGR